MRNFWKLIPKYRKKTRNTRFTYDLNLIEERLSEYSVKKESREVCHQVFKILFVKQYIKWTYQQQFDYGEDSANKKIIYFICYH